jgi:stage II sporulation protein D
LRIALRYLALLAVLLIPLGCSQDVDIPPSNFTGQVPIVRVLLLSEKDSVVLSAPKTATFGVKGSTPIAVPVPTGGMRLVASPYGWRIGSLNFPKGELLVTPATGTALAVNGTNYRGRIRLVPSQKNKNVFDVVNDLDIDSYLMGVISKELYDSWEPATYRAQAIVARTYALFSIHEAKAPDHAQHFDVYCDERSQVYGGLDAETAKSREAVQATASIVVCYGPAGREKIFKAYFSSCCGGVTQSAADAFGDAYVEPLSDQTVNARCSNAPRFNWGPVIVKKDELTRRFRIFGQRLNRAEQSMAPVSRIDIQKVNRFGRPVRFLVTDVKGQRFSWSGEEIRWAINADAPAGSSVYSSFFKIINEPDAVRFVEGHGHGHGVGMCQWCAEKLADEGMRHEDIVLAAFQRAVLKRAY